MEQKITEWLHWLGLKCSAETCKSYAFDVRALAAWGGRQSPALGAAEDFRLAHLTLYLAERRKAGVGPAAQKRAVGAFRNFFSWAVGKKRSPARSLPYPRVPRKQQRTLNKAEALDVLASCDTSSLVGARDLAILAVMLDAGLRAAEVCRLKLADVDLARRLLFVVVKGGQQRFGTLSPYSVMLVSQWLAYRPAVAHPEEGALFVAVATGGQSGGRGHALTRQGLLCLCRRLSARAGVAHFSPHALRRAFATLAISFGASTRVVQVAGGWSDVALVERYTQALDPAVFDAYAPVSRLMADGAR